MLKRNLTVLVIGDVMLDTYLHVDVNRISPESPTPICDVINTTYSPGGAGNVAANIVSLGGKAILVGAGAVDNYGERLHDTLHSFKIDNRIMFIANKTANKVRTVSDHHHIIRHDYSNEIDWNVKNRKTFISNLAYIRRNNNIDAVIISDYNKGLINQEIYMAICDEIREDTPIFIDTKQLFTEFKHGKKLFAFTPNLNEFDKNIKHFGLHNTLETLLTYINTTQGIKVNNLLVTCGKDGMKLGKFNYGIYEEWEIDPLKKLSVYDVTGAGDTAIATYVMAVLSGYESERAAGLANIASGIAVSKLGTSTISLSELYELSAEIEIDNIIRKL